MKIVKMDVLKSAIIPGHILQRCYNKRRQRCFGRQDLPFYGVDNCQT